MLKFLCSGILFIIFLVEFFGCSSNKVSEKAALPELDSTDYVIISAAIEQYIYKPKTLLHRTKVLQEPGRVEFLFFDSTEFRPPKPHVTDIYNLLDSNDKYLSERITSENRNKYFIDSARIKAGIDIKIFSLKELKQYFESKREIFRIPRYVLSVSKPSYSEDRKKSVIYILSVGWDTEDEYLMWLRNENNKWVAYDIINYRD